MNAHPLSPCMWPKCPLVADRGIFVEFVMVDGQRIREHLHFCFNHYPRFTKLPAYERADIITSYLEEHDAAQN